MKRNIYRLYYRVTPKAKGIIYNSILIIINYFTKIV